MNEIAALLLAALLLIGSFFVLIGSYGLVKLSEFFKRLHTPTKATTLGVGCILVASVGYHAVTGADPQPRELLVTAFLFITAPISAHLMAKAALSLKMAEPPSLPEETATDSLDADTMTGSGNATTPHAEKSP